MASPQSKRRKLDQASAVLSRPFKSPLKSVTNQHHQPTTPHASTPAPTSTTDTKTSQLPKNSHSITSNQPKPSKTTPQSPTAKALQADIQTLSNALRLLTSPPSPPLQTLKLKWRTATRAALEELFASAKDRVNRMGGVGAWRTFETERQGRFGGSQDRDEDEGSGESGGESGDEGDREERRQRRREEREARIEFSAYDDAAEDAQATGGNGLVVGQGQDDDAFTMDMMLSIMRIDAGLVGWDMHAQAWID